VGAAIGEDFALGSGIKFGTPANFGATSTKITMGLSDFWRSLSTNSKIFLSGTGGKVIKAGAQVGTSIALPAAGIYSLEQAASPITKGIEQVSGIAGSGQLFIIAIVAFVLILLFIMLVK